MKTLDKKEMKEDHELSILEKLLKINKKVAVIMTSDMILAGVDTVFRINSSFTKNFP